jgi:guanine deaminase
MTANTSRFPTSTTNAKDWIERRLPMHYERRDAAVDVYRLWNERNGGQRKSTIVPPGSIHR